MAAAWVTMRNFRRRRSFLRTTSNFSKIFQSLKKGFSSPRPQTHPPIMAAMSVVLPTMLAAANRTMWTSAS